MNLSSDCGYDSEAVDDELNSSKVQAWYRLVCKVTTADSLSHGGPHTHRSYHDAIGVFRVMKFHAAYMIQPS
jgi:hypothetical protein